MRKKNRKFFLFRSLGDNILTALSVARDCGMVKKHERIILVHAHPGTEDGKQPYIEWEKAEFATDEPGTSADGKDSEVGSKVER